MTLSKSYPLLPLSCRWRRRFLWKDGSAPCKYRDGVQGGVSLNEDALGGGVDLVVVVQVVPAALWQVASNGGGVLKRVNNEWWWFCLQRGGRKKMR